jgi:AraC-like DNA-binding protein
VTIIYLLGALQALFLAALLLAKKRKSTADKVLLAWLSGIGIHTLIYFVYFQFQTTIPLLLNLNAGFPFLQGPFLLAYVAALIGMRERFGGLDYLHLAPFAVFIAYLLQAQGSATFAVSSGDHSRGVSIFSLAQLITLLILVSVPVYIAWSLVLMRRASRVLGAPDVSTTELSSRFRWIRLCIVGLGMVWITVILSLALSRYTGIKMPPHLLFLALTLFVYGLAYMGLTRTSVFLEPELETLKQSLQAKYQKSGLGTEEARLIYAQVETFMEEQRPWLDGDISLRAMATSLGLSTNHLSQVINECEQCSFRDFINARRVSEACRRLDEDSTTNLLDMAMGCGFNSKSSFNRAFRKFTGKSPTGYLESA